MKTEFQLTIISAEKRIYSGIVKSFTAPGIAGSFGVYPDHAPLITTLRKGTITYITNDGEQILNVNGGVVEINKNVATICVE